MEEERWLSVVGYEGQYEVSDLGRVRSLDRVIWDRNGRCVRLRGKLIKPGRTGNRVTVALNGKSFYVHNLVLIAFVGPCPPGKECCHNTTDSTDNCLSNIRWGTRQDNMFDRGKQGTDYHRNLVTCPRGHELIWPNLRKTEWERDGFRKCLACNRAQGEARYAAKKGFTVSVQVAADCHYAKIMATAACVT